MATEGAVGPTAASRTLTVLSGFAFRGSTALAFASHRGAPDDRTPSTPQPLAKRPNHAHRSASRLGLVDLSPPIILAASANQQKALALDAGR